MNPGPPGRYLGGESIMCPRPHRSEEILDELLVLHAQEGSPNAFQKLVERWQERLWRHARRLTGRDDAAWDVLQDSWIGIAGGIAKLRDAGAFRRWAYTIVTRAATSRLRRQAPEEPTPHEDLDRHAVADDDERDEREQAIAELRMALDHLQGDERALLSLRYFEGFELWEISQVLDVPEGTVKSRLHHARKRLKDVLERLQR